MSRRCGAVLEALGRASLTIWLPCLKLMLAVVLWCATLEAARMVTLAAVRAELGQLLQGVAVQFLRRVAARRQDESVTTHFWGMSANTSWLAGLEGLGMPAFGRQAPLADASAIVEGVMAALGDAAAPPPRQEAQAQWQRAAADWLREAAWSWGTARFFALAAQAAR